MPPVFHVLYCTIVLLAFASRGVHAQDDESVRFTYPDKQGLAFYQRDAVTVSYISNIKNASLWTFCREGNNDENVVFKGRIDKAAPNNGSQEVRINFNTNSDNCWFNLRDNDKDDTGFNSPVFSLSADERSQTTLGLGPASTTAPPFTSETSTSASSSTASSSEATHGSSSSTENTNDQSSDGGLSTGAKAGIGVGVALGVIGIAALFGTFLVLRRKKERNGPGSEHERQELHGTAIVENKTNWGGPPVDHGPPQEMSAGYGPERRAGAHEMPA